MTKRDQRSVAFSGQLAAVVVAAGLAWPACAGAAPSEEPRVLTQLGLGQALSLFLLEDETDIIDNFSTTPPACSKLPSAGSIKTLSITQVSKTEFKSKIDTYFDAACKTPYIEATVTVTISEATETFSIAERASLFQTNGKPLGALSMSDTFSEADKIETLRGLGKFAPAGGQPVADLGFTCSIPATDTAKTAECEGGVAQTFKSLNLSVASVVPFSLTASNNTDAPSVKFAGTQSNVRTGKAGTLSITAPTPKTLAIGGGGTEYASTAVSGSEARLTLFPPAPTQWTVTDKKNNARIVYHIVSNTTHAARATVATISPAKSLASIALDRSGTGKVAYSDKTSALIRFFLAAD
jgi:hypothetical protein